MKFRKILSVILFLCGIALIGGYGYLMTNIKEGQKKIASAQQVVDESKFLLGLHPISKQISKNATEEAQGKLNEASETVTHYEAIADYTLGGGIFLVIVGSFLWIFSRKKK